MTAYGPHVPGNSNNDLYRHYAVLGPINCQYRIQEWIKKTIFNMIS